MKRVLVCLYACALGVVARADEVSKTWSVTLPADAAGLTNNAPVTLTDGSYVLKGYIRDAAKRYLAIGGCAAPDDVAAGHALMRDAAGAIIGTGPLDLRGAVTVDGAPSAWTIAHIGQYAFCSEATVPFASVTLPTTLRSMDMATFQGCGEVSGLSSFTLVAPEMTGRVPNNTLLAQGKLKSVLFRVPKVTAFGGYWDRKGYDDFLAETDVSDWDLSSVAYFFGPEKQSYWFRFTKFRGTMRLPALRRLNAYAFFSCPNMNALEAGRDGTLEYVGACAVTNCPSLGSLVLGGAANGWTISTNAFNAVNLTNVTFLTTAPSYEERASVVFGTAETPARQIAFHIPPRGARGWDASWGRLVRAARAPTADERAAFAARFGAFAAEGLVGLVAPSAFRTAREQWLVCGRSPVLRHRVTAAVFDPRFDGDAVTVSPAPDADGLYAAGTRVTLTATANAAKGRFVRWRGTVDAADEEKAVLSLDLARDLDLTAQFAHDWTFALDDPDAGFEAWKRGIISNQVWKLAVTVAETAEHAIKYGTGTRGGAWTDVGEGLLDLNGRVLWPDAPDGVRELTVVGYHGEAFRGPGEKVGEEGSEVYREYIPAARYPRALVLRESLNAKLEQHFRCLGSYEQAVTNLVFECPEMTEKVYTDGFCGFMMKAGRLRVPRLADLPCAYVLSLDDVDVSDWRLDAITNVVGEVKGNYGVYRGMFTGGSKITWRDGKEVFEGGGTYTGTLHLPSLATVQSNAFHNATRLEAAELGSNTVVTSIGTKAFRGCSNLARLRLRAGADLAVGADAFEGTAKLKIFEFTFEAPKNPAAVDNMLAGTTEEVAASADPPVIYASRMMGWTGAQIANIKPPTAEENAARPFWLAHASVIGVWRTAAGARKAWVVHSPSADDPRGTFLLLR